MRKRSPVSIIRRAAGGRILWAHLPRGINDHASKIPDGRPFFGPKIEWTISLRLLQFLRRKNDVVSDMAKISSPSADLDNQILGQRHLLLDPISHCTTDEAVRSRNTGSCSNLDFEVWCPRLIRRFLKSPFPPLEKGI